MIARRTFLGLGLSLVLGRRAARGASRAAPATIYLVGDSTVKNGSGTGAGQLWGWGNFLAAHVDPALYRVENRALGGRSSRTYRSEGLWDRVVAQLQAGDVVLIQFGHNDGGPVATGKARASLKGTGVETQTVERPDRPAEVVHTYGWYLRQYVAEARARGATPIILSPVPRNVWVGADKVARASGDYGRWAGEVAREERARFVDLNELVAACYEALGRDRVGADLFTAADHTHTTRAGAELNAECVAAGLKALEGEPVAAAIRPRPAGDPGINPEIPGLQREATNPLRP